MKRLLLFTFVLGAGLAQGPTKVAPNQIQPPGVAENRVLVFTPSLGWVPAKLDAATLVLDTGLNPPTLRAVVPSASVAYPIEEKFGATGSPPSQAFTVAQNVDPGKLYSVYKNGVLQEEGPDYARVNRVFTFQPLQGIFTGDRVAIRYYTQ